MTEHFHIKTEKGNFIIKDAMRSELSELVSVYKRAFKKHNIFQKSAFRVEEYLLEQHRKNHRYGGGFIIAKKDRSVIGGVLLKWRDCDIKGKHHLWKFNHLVVDKPFKRLGIGFNLVNASVKKIRNLIKEKKFRTAKIEVSTTENDKDLELYKKLGFKVEGKLKSHYRFNEISYILGKEIAKL